MGTAVGCEGKTSEGPPRNRHRKKKSYAFADLDANDRKKLEEWAETYQCSRAELVGLIVRNWFRDPKWLTLIPRKD